MKILDGKSLAEEIKTNVKKEIEQKYLNKKQQPPCLACIIVEGNSASEVYVASKKKACESCGLKSIIVRLPQTITQVDLHKEIDKLNKNKKVSGILLQHKPRLHYFPPL